MIETPSDTDLTGIAKVTCVTPSMVQVEVTDRVSYDQLPNKITIGSYLRVYDDGGPALITIVRSYKLKDITEKPTPSGSGNSNTATTHPEPKVSIVVDSEPVGVLYDGRFDRGSSLIAIPPQKVAIAAASTLQEIFSASTLDRPFCFSTLASDPRVSVAIDGDLFFGRHIAVVGSTGSGKSGAVARILQLGVTSGVDKLSGRNNSHIVILDLHGEYADAFPSGRVLSVQSLALPYWLMNSEELVDMFIESSDENSYNQVSQFRQAILKNKRRHAQKLGCDLSEITHDTPCYFDLAEVLTYISNQNSEIIYKGTSGEPHVPKLADGTLVADPSEYYFDRLHTFIATASQGANKAVNGPFYGQLSRFVMRLEARLDDERLGFLLKPAMDNGQKPVTENRAEIIRSFLGYITAEESNVVIFDFSGVPFEILSVVVSLLSRLIFDLKFQYRRLQGSRDREFPVLLVLEEAHNYVPQDEAARFKSVKRSIERIAKEGRKCGISLMVVSQRPSEVSETILSQCGNFVAMRLTNPADQNYIRRLLPDTLGGLAETLPSLPQRCAILTGDSVPVPSIVKILELRHKPNSHDIAFLAEWEKEWLDLDFHDLLSPSEPPSSMTPEPKGALQELHVSQHSLKIHDQLELQTDQLRAT